jgi:hypothetical protein
MVPRDLLTRAAHAALLLALFGLGGCGTSTVWDSTGIWTGRLAVPDSLARDTRSYTFVPPGGTQDDRIRLCASGTLGIGMPLGTSAGTISAVRLQLADPLCRIGTAEITGGTVYVYRPVEGDSTTVGSQPDTGWTFEGQVDVTTYQDFGDPDIDVDESATTETAAGTVSFTAIHAPGDTIRLTNGTWSIEITKRKFRRSLS